MSVPDVVIRPITAEDFARMYPQGGGYSLRGWSVDVDGSLAAVAAVILGPAPTLVMNLPDPSKYPPRLVLEVSRQVMARVGEHFSRVYAICDPGKANAAKFLSRLGFRFIRAEGALEVYKWHKP